MKYKPIQALMSYYQKTAGFLKSHLRQGELEVEIEKTDPAGELRRAKLKEVVDRKRQLLNYAAAARYAQYDGRYRNRSR